MAQGLNINFHQTFRPEAQYIAAILDLIADGVSRNVAEISQATGIPNGKSSGKVEPHLNYAAYMGLVSLKKDEGNYVISKTTLGEEVYAEDPGLQEKLTLLLLHCMILREEAGAKMWAVVFRDILPRYKTGIKKDLLLKELNSVLEGNVTVKNTAPLFGSYESFFGCLGVLDVKDDFVRLCKVAYDKEYIYLYALVLYEYWEERFKGQDEITSSQLEELRYRDAFGWDSKEEYEVLEKLSDGGIIRLNRQLMPFTLLKLKGRNDLIGKLYSELC